MQLRILVIFVTICHSVCPTIADSQDENENWMKPHAWSQEMEKQSSVLENEYCLCHTRDSLNDQASVLLFRKFIRALFNREILEYDEQYSIYQRELVFTVLPAQLEKLEKLTDPRDLDSVLTEIFGNVRSPNKFNRRNSTWTNIFALIWDIPKAFLMLLRYSEVQFIMIALAFIMIVWFIHRRHNIGIVIVILSGFFLFGYFVTYLECNRELELKEMLEVIEKSEATKISEPRWYNVFGNWFGEDKAAMQREEIKKSKKLNLSFCRPDHVLILYLNEIFYKQLELFIEKCVSSIETVRNTLSWPYSLFAVPALILLLIYIIKLVFKHIISPRNWVGLFNQPRTSTGGSQHQILENLTHHEDRLSGENLRVLLSAIKSPNIFVSNSNLPVGSCVQEVALEALTQKSDNSSNSSSSSNTSSTKSVTFEADILNSSSPKNLNETLVGELNTAIKECDKPESDFEVISRMESKVTLEDVPDD